MKKILLLVSLVFLFSSCAVNETNTVLDNSYITSNVRVTEVEPLEEKKFSEVLWVNPADEVLKDEVDMVVKGEITDVKEIEFKYESYGKESTEYAAVFEFKVTEAFATDIDSPKTIKVYTEISSRNIPVEFEDDVITEGKEYYLLLKNLENLENDVFNIVSLADYFLLYPVQFLIPANVTQDKIDQVFEPFTSEKNKTTYVETIEKDGLSSAEDLENFFREYFK